MGCKDVWCVRGNNSGGGERKIRDGRQEGNGGRCVCLLDSKDPIVFAGTCRDITKKSKNNVHMFIGRHHGQPLALVSTLGLFPVAQLCGDCQCRSAQWLRDGRPDNANYILL